MIVPSQGKFTIKLIRIIAESSLHLGVSCQQLTAVKDEESSSEGSTVTLTCKYTKGSADYFFWYRQHPGKPPEFLISHLESGQISLNPVPCDCLRRVRKEETQMDLQISSAAVTDSAVYYCAENTGTYKLIFGSGTRLIVESRAEYKPSYFKLQHDGTTACLATGFSRHNAALGHRNYSNLFNDSEAVRISPDLALYNQVIFLDDSEDACEESSGEDVPCVDTMSPDKTVSMASVAVLGLRVILFKTIVFNVLLTMRLWISQ
nr:T cell receptor alpha chain [Stegastes partitus]